MSRTVGHYAPWALAVLVGGLIVLTLAPAAAVLVPWPVLVGLLAVAGYLGVAILAHNRRLCERCIAALPLDASTVAARYRARFRVAHLFERRAFAVGYLGVVLASAVVSAHPVGRYVWATVEASMVYLLFVYVTHQRLQPWCPRCRGGGEELTAPTAPSPVSSHS